MLEPSWETLPLLPLPMALARLQCLEPCMPAWVSMRRILLSVAEAPHAYDGTVLSSFKHLTDTQLMQEWISEPCRVL